MTKANTLDIDAYEKLESAKIGRESFSSVVHRTCEAERPPTSEAVGGGRRVMILDTNIPIMLERESRAGVESLGSQFLRSRGIGPSRRG